MNRTIKNTISVLATTTVLALAVFAVVQVGFGGSAGTTATTAVATGGATQTCPRTGCAASSCHATQGLSPQQAYGSTASNSSPPSSGSNATAVSNPSPGSSGGTLTCPATGCTASSCHATLGGGGHGDHDDERIGG